LIHYIDQEMDLVHDAEGQAEVEAPENLPIEQKPFDNLDHGIADEDIGNITAKPLPIPSH